ncbi:hypothetical protein [Scytonema sp. HK-05]|uniref:hypothetical protein n=1 Tax=Scytonema sp. HK-05 TaxID=1137095 RepID=UPI0011611081|nr:hypothetical protein [Scytonema sp. HK-05]
MSRFFLRKQILNLLRLDLCIFVLDAVFIAVERLEQAIAMRGHWHLCDRSLVCLVEGLSTTINLQDKYCCLFTSAKDFKV